MNQNNDWLNWWNSLPKFWRAQLIHHMEWNDDPTSEQLPKLLTLEQGIWLNRERLSSPQLTLSMIQTLDELRQIIC